MESNQINWVSTAKTTLKYWTVIEEKSRRETEVILQWKEFIDWQKSLLWLVLSFWRSSDYRETKDGANLAIRGIKKLEETAFKIFLNLVKVKRER